MKAILVIDEMPKSCSECKFADFGKCWGSTSYIHLSANDVPKECPLKPMPEKKFLTQPSRYYWSILEGWYKDGWNACLEEIEK